MATVSTRGVTAVEDFVAKLKDRMEALGLTPVTLAEKAKVGYPYLYRVLKGQQSPSFDWAERVGKCVGLVIKVEAKKSPKKIA